MYRKFNMNIIFEGYVSCWINNMWLMYLDIAVEMWSYGATVLDI
jgi:hypothetical protein